MMYTGTSAEQDTRFSDKEKKLLKQMKFGECLTKRVDMSKVKLDAIKPWICKKITEVLGMDDDVVVEFVYNQLEGEKFPDPKKMQINLTGFLNGKNARLFMTDLWELLLSAQDSVSGIPELLIEMKKEEIKKKMEEQDRLQDITRKLEKERESENERRKDRKHNSQGRDYYEKKDSSEHRKSRDQEYDKRLSTTTTSPKHRQRNEDVHRKDSGHSRPSPPKNDTNKQKQKNVRRSSSLSSPDYKKDGDDFEIHKKEDSVQKKRHYRSNKFDSSSSGTFDQHESHSRQKQYDKYEQKHGYKSFREYSDYTSSKRLSKEKDLNSNTDYKKSNTFVKEKYTDKKPKRSESEKEYKHSNVSEKKEIMKKSNKKDDYDNSDNDRNDEDIKSSNDDDTNQTNDEDSDDMSDYNNDDDDDVSDENEQYNQPSDNEDDTDNENVNNNSNDDDGNSEDEENDDVSKNKKRKMMHVDENNEKNKKKMKKHKKHKKHKHKKKKTKKNESSEEYSDPDEIERHLREKALQSLKRRQ